MMLPYQTTSLCIFTSWIIGESSWKHQNCIETKKEQNCSFIPPFTQITHTLFSKSGFTVVRAFARDNSRFLLSSSSTEHTWTRARGLQLPPQVGSWETSFPTCPNTWMKSEQNCPSCCTANHEQPSKQLPWKPSLKKRFHNRTSILIDTGKRKSRNRGWTVSRKFQRSTCLSFGFYRHCTRK